jgi:hypothetical protein
VQDSKSIFIYTKSRLDWGFLSSAVSEVWHKQILDSAYPISIMRVPFSGLHTVSDHNPTDDVNLNLLKLENDSVAFHSVQIKKIRILGDR